MQRTVHFVGVVRRLSPFRDSPVLPNHSIDQLVSKIKQDLVRGVTASWKVWPLVHVINFRFIPPQQRLLYINSIQVMMDACMWGLGAFGVHVGAF